MDKARDELERLLDLYVESWRTPLLFDPYFASLDEKRRERWTGDVYQRWVLGGQRPDADPVEGIVVLPGHTFDDLKDKILGGIP